VDGGVFHRIHFLYLAKNTEGSCFSIKKIIFVTKFKNMTETIATPTATTEQVKAAILELIKENDPQLGQWLKAALKNHLPKMKNGVAKKTSPRSELPFWKAHPDWQPFDATPYAISEESLKKVQKAWADAPPAEEIIAYLTK
jgi:hypothetical protein